MGRSADWHPCVCIGEGRLLHGLKSWIYRLCLQAYAAVLHTRSNMIIDPPHGVAKFGPTRGNFCRTRPELGLRRARSGRVSAKSPGICPKSVPNRSDARRNFAHSGKVVFDSGPNSAEFAPDVVDSRHSIEPDLFRSNFGRSRSRPTLGEFDRAWPDSGKPLPVHAAGLVPRGCLADVVCVGGGGAHLHTTQDPAPVFLPPGVAWHRAQTGRLRRPRVARLGSPLRANPNAAPARQRAATGEAQGGGAACGRPAGAAGRWQRRDTETQASATTAISGPTRGQNSLFSVLPRPWRFAMSHVRRVQKLWLVCAC